MTSLFSGIVNVTFLMSHGRLCQKALAMQTILFKRIVQTCAKGPLPKAPEDLKPDMRYLQYFV